MTYIQHVEGILYLIRGWEVGERGILPVAGPLHLLQRARQPRFTRGGGGGLSRLGRWGSCWPRWWVIFSPLGWRSLISTF